MLELNKIQTIIILGLTHLIIDATCIFILYSGVYQNLIDTTQAFSYIVLYNVLAFGLQFLIGILFDKTNSAKICALFGCLISIFSVLFVQIYPFAAILAGIGNAFFHVGGGSIALNLGDKKATIPGIFVAPGTLGLFIGAFIAKNQIFSISFFFILLILSFIFICFINSPKKQKKNIQNHFNKFYLILYCLLLAIILRSFIGLSINIEWKESIKLGLYLTLSIMFGKIFGGIIADKYGWIKTTIIALLVSSPLIAFGINKPILFILGIFFFNFTMPITLVAVSNIMNQRNGFAFGLTTLALLIGAIPSFTGVNLSSNNAIIIFLIIIFSAIFLYIGLEKYASENK